MPGSVPHPEDLGPSSCQAPFFLPPQGEAGLLPPCPPLQAGPRALCCLPGPGGQGSDRRAGPAERLLPSEGGGRHRRRARGLPEPPLPRLPPQEPRAALLRVSDSLAVVVTGSHSPGGSTVPVPRQPSGLSWPLPARPAGCPSLPATLCPHVRCVFLPAPRAHGYQAGRLSFSRSRHRPGHQTGPLLPPASHWVGGPADFPWSWFSHTVHIGPVALVFLAHASTLGAAGTPVAERPGPCLVRLTFCWEGSSSRGRGQTAGRGGSRATSEDSVTLLRRGDMAQARR